MYEEDLYDENQLNDYALRDDENDDSDGYQFQNTRHHEADNMSSSSISTAARRKRKLFEDNTNIDKGYCKIHIRIDGRKVPVEYYHSSFYPGSTIRNAVTGIYESGYKVGKWHEDLFFKVMNGNGSNCNQLFYDSPQQYEKHFLVTVSDSVKEKWDNKALNARQRRIAESHVDREFTEIR